jgi:hypothetical protein
MRVSETLSVVIHTTAGDVHASIERRDGGLVRIEPDELAGLLGALRAAAGALAVAIERGERKRGALGQ